jgi:hypothetical protein
MSASPLKADIIGRERDVRYGPITVIRKRAISGHPREKEMLMNWSQG